MDLNPVCWPHRTFLIPALGHFLIDIHSVNCRRIHTCITLHVRYLTCEVFRIQLPLRINVSLIGHYFMSLFVVSLSLLIIKVLRCSFLDLVVQFFDESVHIPLMGQIYSSN